MRKVECDDTGCTLKAMAPGNSSIIPLEAAFKPVKTIKKRSSKKPIGKKRVSKPTKKKQKPIKKTKQKTNKRKRV